MMESSGEVFLVIINTALEEHVYGVLQASDVGVSGRYLSIEDIPRDCRQAGILLTTSDLISEETVGDLRREFLGIILLGESNSFGLTTLPLSEIDQLPKKLININPTVSELGEIDGFPKIIGVLPRVGVRTLREAIESNVQQEVPLLGRKLLNERSVLYCSEIDDASLFSLFELINEDKGRYQRHGVVLTKIPQMRHARERIKAIERELQVFGISIVATLPFDQELQVRGELSKQSRHALEPLFDWITKAN